MVVMSAIALNEIATTLYATETTIPDVLCRTVGMLTTFAFMSTASPFPTVSDIVP